MILVFYLLGALLALTIPLVITMAGLRLADWEESSRTYAAAHIAHLTRRPP